METTMGTVGENAASSAAPQGEQKRKMKYLRLKEKTERAFLIFLIKIIF